MAYITAAEVDYKRKLLKGAFPTWKFSITKEHHSSIHVSILEADIDFFDDEYWPAGQRDSLSQVRQQGYCSVNHYWLDSHWQGAALEALQSILKTVDVGNYNNSDLMSDYHDVGFYVHIAIGKWNKPFVFKPGSPSPVKKAA